MHRSAALMIGLSVALFTSWPVPARSALPVPEPTIVSQVSNTTATVNQSVITDAVTLTGPNGPVTGTVSFFICGPTGSATPCVSGGTQAGTKTLNGGQATSDAFTATAAGTYCFRVEYTPDATVQYAPSVSTITTNECFTAVVPPPSIGASAAGYWKNHLANSTSTGPYYSTDCQNARSYGGSCSNNGPWAIQYLPKPLGNYQVNTVIAAAQVLGGANCGSSKDRDAIGCLTSQLLATKLSLANGSLACPGILQTVADADAFLKGQTVNGVPGINYVGPGGSYTLTPAQRDLALSLKNKLETYNNNVACP